MNQRHSCVAGRCSRDPLRDHPDVLHGAHARLLTHCNAASGYINILGTRLDGLPNSCPGRQIHGSEAMMVAQGLHLQPSLDDVQGVGEGGGSEARAKSSRGLDGHDLRCRLGLRSTLHASAVLCHTCSHPASSQSH